ncbi:MAG TPA: ABC transporter substrate-binding protein [Steroidobacter sp.]|uniref:ABC transporter substrate-binding protein n=1 Tax=Steroidobacter sp. TaxID=1978227 RepID=UPI002ED8170E
MSSPVRSVLLSCLAWLAGLAPLSASAADADAVKRSKSERDVLIYSNIAAYNWGPIIEAFHAKYPWLKVEALDLGPAEAFERYYSEASVKRRTADIIAVAAPDTWMRFIDRDQVEPYVTPEAAALPEWSKPVKGVYTISADPVVLIYNKLLLKTKEQRPDSLDGLAAQVRKQPMLYAKRLTTYDATSHPFAYALHWAYVHQRGQKGWETLRTLGPQTRPEGGGATMVEKITAGEYVGAYFGSSVTFLRRMKEEGREQVLEWALMRDGTPVMVRGMAITRAASHKAAAQLFVDFALSREGQIAVGKGGLTPYRPDVPKSAVPFLTFDSVRDTVGEANVILVGYDRTMLQEQNQFLSQWKASYGLKR